MNQPFRFVLRSDPSYQTSIPFVYFHGKLEDAIDAHQRSLGWDWDCPDLVGVSDGTGVSDETLLGATNHEVYGMPVRAFIWRHDGRLRGLIVALSDEASVAYAEEKFALKGCFL